MEAAYAAALLRPVLAAAPSASAGARSPRGRDVGGNALDRFLAAAPPGLLRGAYLHLAGQQQDGGDAGDDKPCVADEPAYASTSAGDFASGLRAAASRDAAAARERAAAAVADRAAQRTADTTTAVDGDDPAGSAAPPTLHVPLAAWWAEHRQSNEER